MEALAVGVVQYVYILLLGLQSRFVRDNQRTHAALTSFLLAVSVLFIQPAIIKATLLDPSSTVLVAFVFAGPAGIISGMFLHEKFFARD